MSLLDQDIQQLLAQLREELDTAVDALEDANRAHRTVESVLLSVLEHVPVALVVLDGDGKVRAVTAEAEALWSARLDARLGWAADAVRAAVESGTVDTSSLPEGTNAAVLDEPGTGARYLTLWSTQAPTTGS